MPRRYFGTDGVRGVVGEDLTADLVERLGRAATLWSGRGRIFVGGDTRASGVELEHVLERFGSDLSALKICVDCANGAYSGLAPTAFEQLGADVTTIGNDPDGHNINVGCGATDLRALQPRGVGDGLDLGVAFDGDGDRMLAVDANGAVVDGDQIVALLALHLNVGDVTVTPMTNRSE